VAVPSGSDLRAIAVPLDLHVSWNSMMDELNEKDIDDDLTGEENLQALALLRPNVWDSGIS
jgi:hypothetical protein